MAAVLDAHVMVVLVVVRVNWCSVNPGESRCSFVLVTMMQCSPQHSCGYIHVQICMRVAIWTIIGEELLRGWYIILDRMIILYINSLCRMSALNTVLRGKLHEYIP
jgi:hypothetical protein